MRADELFACGRILLLAAHPDDETIGAGAQLPRWRDRIEIVHATNGSPGNNAEYAAARRIEMLRAVGLAGVLARQCRELGFIDQRASFHLAELALRIRAIVEEFQPAVILTHPYEGGHPDHDACAFAAQWFADPEVEVWEFASYHMGAGGAMASGAFLEGPGLSVALSGPQQQLKREMFDCFQTQKGILERFRLDAETFRPAPEYDFAQPPHPGPLYYEQFDWGVTGARWRDLAGDALLQLEPERNATHGA